MLCRPGLKCKRCSPGIKYPLMRTINSSLRMPTLFLYRYLLTQKLSVWYAFCCSRSSTLLECQLFSSMQWQCMTNSLHYICTSFGYSALQDYSQSIFMLVIYILYRLWVLPLKWLACCEALELAEHFKQGRLSLYCLSVF